MQVGILLNNIGNNQAAYMAINHANAIHRFKLGHVIELYIKNLTQPVVRPMCMVNSIDKGALVKDVLISTDLCTCKYMNNMIAEHKLFYIFDLEWLRHEVDYIETIKMLNNTRLLCGSKEHQEAIQKYCGLESKVIESFNLQRILNECIR